MSGGPARVFVARIEVVPGEEPRTFELGERVPRWIELQFLDAGAALPDVVLIATETGGEPGQPRNEQAGVASHVGRLKLGPLFVGEWQLCVQSPTLEWCALIEEPLHVGPGMPQDLTIELHLTEGSLQLVDAEDGAALANASVMLTLGDELHRKTLETDASGRITLTQPAGVVRLSRKGGSREPITHVPWPPAAGEVPTVRLP